MKSIAIVAIIIAIARSSTGRLTVTSLGALSVGIGSCRTANFRCCVRLQHRRNALEVAEKGLLLHLDHCGQRAQVLAHQLNLAVQLCLPVAPAPHVVLRVCARARTSAGNVLHTARGRGRRLGRRAYSAARRAEMRDRSPVCRSPCCRRSPPVAPTRCRRRCSTRPP